MDSYEEKYLLPNLDTRWIPVEKKFISTFTIGYTEIIGFGDTPEAAENFFLEAYRLYKRTENKTKFNKYVGMDSRSSTPAVAFRF